MEEDICKVIDMDNLPEHIAIIMDGNRRWAKANKLTTAQGHKEVYYIEFKQFHYCSNFFL